MLGWGDGLRVNPGVLQARAAKLHQVKGQLDAQITEHANIDLGPWRGDAQRAQYSNHRKLLTGLQTHAMRIPPAAGALGQAANAFTQIQQSQHSLVSRAASWQYAIQDSGWVTDTASGIAKLNPLRLQQRIRIQGSVVSIVARLNATDIALAAALKGADVVGDVLSGIANNGAALADILQLAADKGLSGFEWANGKIKDGLDWGKDKIEDAAHWAMDTAANIAERLGHAGTAYKRFLESAAQQPQWVTDFFEKGEVPQLAEVLGQGLFLGGQAIGVPLNFLTNEDQHFFDDGKPWLADANDVKPYTVEHDRFGSVNDVVNPMMDVYNTHDPKDPTDHPQIQVTAVEGADGQVRYVVSIPGTTESLNELRGWNGNPAGTDWTANLKGVGYGDTAATQSIMHSIDLAIQQDQQARGISGGTPEVLLTGHSQGGIIAGNIANNAEFAGRYNVGGVISAGSPVDTLGIPKDIPVYNYQNALDPVPRSDLGGVPHSAPENVTNIVFPHEGSISPMHTHLQQTYVDNIAGLQQEAANPSNISDNARLQRQMDAELGRFYNGEVTNAYRVEYGRETTDVRK